MDSGAWPYFVWRLFDSLFFYPDSILCRIEATALGTIVIVVLLASIITIVISKRYFRKF